MTHQVANFPGDRCGIIIFPVSVLKYLVKLLVQMLLIIATKIYKTLVKSLMSVSPLNQNTMVAFSLFHPVPLECAKIAFKKIFMESVATKLQPLGKGIKLK